MILQSLYNLYTRLAEDPKTEIPKPGFSVQNITFEVVIQSDGTLVDILPAQITTVQIGKNGKEKTITRPLSLLVPGQGKPSGSGLNPCLLWDQTGYMLGYKPDDKKPERSVAAFEAFRKHHLDLEQSINDPSFSAICRFLEQWNPLRVADYPILAEIKSGFGVFQISGETRYVHQSPRILEWWNQRLMNPREAEQGFCLVTGSNSALAQLHDPAIKGVAGAQSMGAKLVSFNLNAFASYGKEQGLNSPVSENAAFAYCNALNYLLASRSRRFRIGDATTIFWTDKPTPAEDLLPWMLAGAPDSEDDETKHRLKNVLEKISSGALNGDELGDPNVPYYILGLSPNASRLSIRFWHSGNLGELVSNLQKHFEHLRLVRQWDETNSKKPEPIAPSAYQLLRQTARDADGVPPLLGGALMRSILLGTPYPNLLINGVMNRIRVVEKKPNGEGSLDNVSYLRASILKAWLIRNHKIPISTMLDKDNTNFGYRLGRLFAVLERTQQEALPGINATIRDRFYASASATPRAVFGRLLRMYPNHLGKAQSEWAGKFGSEKALHMKNGREIQVQEILGAVSDFPAHFNLQNQAQFALGYYHQRKDFFTKKETKAPEVAAV